MASGGDAGELSTTVAVAGAGAGAGAGMVVAIASLAFGSVADAMGSDSLLLPQPASSETATIVVTAEIG